jgi:predicted O-methyltransferase YrrM
MTRFNPLRVLRGGIRDLRYGLAIRRSKNYVFLKFAPPGHFYSPLPDLNEISAASDAAPNNPVRELKGINLNVRGQLQHVQQFAAYNCELSLPDSKSSGCRYYLDNGFFSYGDAVSLFGMMRLYSPTRIVEIGSGFSSALMLDVNDRFFSGRDIDFTFIEPYPSRLLGLINDTDRDACRIVEEHVQNVPGEIFTALDENDILFIDSSHVAKANSDVLYILFSILPMVKPGVLIHFHDMLWPFEYPYLWLKEGRAWNEAYFVRAFLQYNDAFSVSFFNSYLERNHEACLREYLPVMLRPPSSKATPGNSSLWLRKVR